MPFEINFTWVSTAKSASFGATFPISEMLFKPMAFINPKPEIEASFAAPESNLAACFADLTRITSSVKVTVTAIAF